MPTSPGSSSSSTCSDPVARRAGRGGAPRRAPEPARGRRRPPPTPRACASPSTRGCEWGSRGGCPRRRWRTRTPTGTSASRRVAARPPAPSDSSSGWAHTTTTRSTPRRLAEERWAGGEACPRHTSAGVPGPRAMKVCAWVTRVHPVPVFKDHRALTREVALGVVLAQVDRQVGDASRVRLVAGQRARAEGVPEPGEDLVGGVGHDLPYPLADQPSLSAPGDRRVVGDRCRVHEHRAGAGERGVDGPEGTSATWSGGAVAGRLPQRAPQRRARAVPDRCDAGAAPGEAGAESDAGRVHRPGRRERRRR